MDAHEPGQNHADEHRYQRERVILFADHFVIEAKDPLANEASGLRVLVNRSLRWKVMHG
jgi:hypothetical protein